MADLPKIDSEGLRLAKKLGAERVSSVTRVSKKMTNWTPETESFSTDGPQCPQCGFTFTPDEPHYFDESGYTEDECPGCQTKFKVEVHHSVSWTCEVIARK